MNTFKVERNIAIKNRKKNLSVVKFCFKKISNNFK